jgi:hypothetical protein
VQTLRVAAARRHLVDQRGMFVIRPDGRSNRGTMRPSGPPACQRGRVLGQPLEAALPAFGGRRPRRAEPDADGSTSTHDIALDVDRRRSASSRCGSSPSTRRHRLLHRRDRAHPPRRPRCARPRRRRVGPPGPRASSWRA